mgnify:FL=1
MPICQIYIWCVVPDVCGQGLTKKLINSVYSTAHLHECDCVYWLTHENKNTAQQVYDQIAQKTQFMQYRMLEHRKLHIADKIIVLKLQQTVLSSWM